MVSFVDEYERQLDERGRIILPSKLRDDIKDTVYITQSTSEKCLHLYTEEEWEKVAQKVNQLPTATDRNAAAFVRLFFGKATAVSVDKQGRVPVSKRLIEYAVFQKMSCWSVRIRVLKYGTQRSGTSIRTSCRMLCLKGY